MSDESGRMRVPGVAGAASFMGAAIANAAEQEKTATEAQIIHILRDHTDRGVIDGWAYCKCGWFIRDHRADAHRRHIARELAAAGLVKR